MKPAIRSSLFLADQEVRFETVIHPPAYTAQRLANLCPKVLGGTQDVAPAVIRTAQFLIGQILQQSVGESPSSRSRSP